MEFNDFCSKNGWVVQYYHYQGVIGESFITRPPVRPPNRSCDILRGWTVTGLEDWFKELDEATVITNVLAQPQENTPAIELILFPAPDGFWYGTTEQQSIYVRVCCFKPHPRLQSWDWEEKFEANRLLNVQDQLARAARIIWRAIQLSSVA